MLPLHITLFSLCCSTNPVFRDLVFFCGHSHGVFPWPITRAMWNTPCLIPNHQTPARFQFPLWTQNSDQDGLWRKWFVKVHKPCKQTLALFWLTPLLMGEGMFEKQPEDGSSCDAFPRSLAKPARQTKPPLSHCFWTKIVAWSGTLYLSGG